MSMLQPVRKTVADYLAFDEERVELVEGEFLVTAAPTPQHQRIVRNLILVINPQVVALGLGEVFPSPVDCVLADDSVVQPDVVFISKAHSDRVRRLIEGPPDVAIEVLSENDPGRDLRTKLDLYFKRRVPEYWIVDPEAETITVRVWSETGWRVLGTFGRGQSAGSIEMPGVTAPVDAVLEWSEGVESTRSVLARARRERMPMAIVEEVHNVLFEDKDPRPAVADLLTRGAKSEVEDF